MQPNALPFGLLNTILPIYLGMAGVMAALISHGIVADATHALAQAREDMRGQVQVTSDALSQEIAAYQHDARLLVLEKEDLMAAILAAADPNDFVFDLAETTNRWFPKSLAFTVANETGQPLVTDFKGNIGAACLADLKRSATKLLDLAPLHGLSSVPHFDIAVPIDSRAGVNGVYLVTFSTDRLVSLLNQRTDSRFELGFTNPERGVPAAPNPDDVTSHRVPGSEIVIHGQIKQPFQAALQAEKVVRLAMYTGGFLLFAGLGGWLLWRARARILQEAQTIRALNEELSNLSLRDPLTGLMNRRGLDAHCRTTLMQSQRDDQVVSMALIDIDHFKRVNDQQGHEAGDNCLRLVGEILQEAAQRPLDIAIRYGGEEFLLCWYGTAAEEAVALAMAVQARVREMPFRHQDGSPVTLSMGIASRPAGGNEASTDLINRADAALYRAKHNGRDRIELG